MGIIDVLPFRACLVSAPKGEVQIQGRANASWHKLGLNGPSVYTLDGRNECSAGIA
jgi:hypothetical protein